MVDDQYQLLYCCIFSTALNCYHGGNGAHCSESHMVFDYLSFGVFKRLIFLPLEVWCCSLVVKSCLTLCDPMDQSMPGPPVFHCLLELDQIHVGSFNDTVQPSHPLSSPSSLAFNSFQISGSFPGSLLFSSDGQSTGVSASGSVHPVSTQG